MQTTIENYFVPKNNQTITSFLSIPADIFPKIFDYMSSPFAYLTLSEVSKQFEANLNNDAAWHEKFKEIIKPVSSFGLPIRS